MKWTEPKPPTQAISNYDHVICETPLGKALIEWKGWKESDSYSLTIGNDYIGEGDDLDDAKRLAKEWLIKKHKELSQCLNSVSTTNSIIYLIEKIWINSMENNPDDAIGYESFGYVKTEEEAKGIVKNGRKFTSKDCWAITGTMEEFRYSTLYYCK